ncbi:hypothetical protein [Methylobacterium fujisawaense]|uniref:hypothetical protein n=1 Tax=Methylobacterium fujisawaense TaxID=107400 RepID=UPI00313C517E
MPFPRRAVLGGLAATACAVTSVKAEVKHMRIGVAGAGWLGGTVGKVCVQAAQ